MCVCVCACVCVFVSQYPALVGRLLPFLGVAGEAPSLRTFNV
jgi:hypothetical protein